MTVVLLVWHHAVLLALCYVVDCWYFLIFCLHIYKAGTKHVYISNRCEVFIRRMFMVLSSWCQNSNRIRMLRGYLAKLSWCLLPIGYWRHLKVTDWLLVRCCTRIACSWLYITTWNNALSTLRVLSTSSRV